MRPFLLGKSLSYHVFHSKWLQDWMTTLPKKEAGAGGGLEAFGAVPTCPFFSEEHWGEHGPSRAAFPEPCPEMTCLTLRRVMSVGKGSGRLRPLQKSLRALVKCFP